MVFNSLQFLIFLPVVLLVNYILPKKVRYLWLLISSYYFYMCWSAKYALLIAFSTIVTYFCGILTEKFRKKGAKVVVAASLVINLGILFFFKYFNFTFSILGTLLSRLHIAFNAPVIDVLLPVGISFYTFQALGYTIDVYRGQIKAERNIFRYALFVSFFPQLVAGPIERSKNLMSQLEEAKDFSFDNAREGILLMLWGFFLKIVIADRIAIFVDCVYDAPDTYTGLYLILASILFAFQIYCDFAGYSTIAMGSAKMLGINLMENFSAPYLSSSVASFWRKWHISLTTWFKDYLYIPLGGNRKGKIRKYFNKIFVFLVSGLWHGAGISYVIWGGLNGLYQVIAEILTPLRHRLHLDSKCALSSLFRGIFTFILVDFAWIFFRAKSFTEACIVLKNIFIPSNFDIISCGLDMPNIILLVVSLLLLLIADIFKSRNICIREKICHSNATLQILIVSVSICAILLFGIWGPGYDAANFIYFQF